MADNYSKTSIRRSLFGRILYFYIDGFKSMTIGKTLWVIILIKLFIIFFVLKLFFFPNFLKSHGDTDEERADYVRSELLKNK